MSLPNFKRRLLAGISLAGLALGASAMAGSPRVTHLFPSGGQRGSEVEITCTGSSLEDATGMLFDDANFEVTRVSAEKGKFQAKVKIKAEAHLGEHTFRVITASGLSDLRLFFVTPFPLIAESESKERPEQAQPISLGSTVYGNSAGEDQDKFQVELKQGQRLSLEVIGARLQTQTLYDPTLTVTASDGTVLATADDCAFTRQDPAMSVIAPADGSYFITIKDSTNSGPGPCHYLLNVGSFPRPLAVFPAGGPAGEDLAVTVIGDASGTIEQKVRLPEHPGESFAFFPTQEESAMQPHLLRVSSFPNVLEAEPNHDPAKAPQTDAGVPFAFNGIISEKGDIDSLRFQAKKDAEYEVTVYSRRLRSPLDAVLSIYDAKGSRVAQNDDSGGPDSYLRWKAPADGEFVIAVQDQLLRGGATFVYRIEVTRIQPRVTMWLPEMVPNSNQERRAIVVPKGNRSASLVRLKRADVAGNIELVPVGLPAGLTAAAPAVEKSVDTIPMVFEAAGDAAETAQSFTFQTKLAEPPKDVSVTTGIEHPLDIAENGNQPAFYSMVEKTLPVQISAPVPVKISLVPPKVPLLQAGSLNLKVIAERTDDFKGPISLALLYTPPGLGTAGTVQLKEGENEGSVTISANGNAPLQKWQLCVVGSADFGKGGTWFSTQLVEIEVAAAYLGGKIARTFVDQGDSSTVTVKLEQKLPFEGKAKLQLLGLPPNTTAEPQEVSKDDAEVKFTVKAEKGAPAGQHKQLFCQFSLTRDGEQMTSSFGNGGILRIDKGAIAKNEEPKK